MTPLEEISRGKHVSLTTYRKNGDAIATPVWHAVDGGELFIVSNADAWKVRRIRNNSQVVITVCGIRGKIKPGAATLTGAARLLDQTQTQAARVLLARKYLSYRLGSRLAKILRQRPRPLVGIAVAF